MGECKFIIAGGERLWIAGSEVGAKDIQGLESQAKKMTWNCREWGLTKMETDLMKSSLKANSENLMKDEVQRREVEREGTRLLSVIYVVLIMCQPLL